MIHIAGWQGRRRGKGRKLLRDEATVAMGVGPKHTEARFDGDQRRSYESRSRFVNDDGTTPVNRLVDISRCLFTHTTA